MCLGVAHRLTDFVITLANKVIGCGKTLKIGHRFEIPHDGMGSHGSHLILHSDSRIILSRQLKRK